MAQVLGLILAKHMEWGTVSSLRSTGKRHAGDGCMCHNYVALMCAGICLSFPLHVNHVNWGAHQSLWFTGAHLCFSVLTGACQCC
eukprot:1156745-Pelagomonas_calceolata.AAC.2